MKQRHLSLKQRKTEISKLIRDGIELGFSEKYQRDLRTQLKDINEQLKQIQIKRGGKNGILY